MKRTVFVGMSGGVDSAVAAALLKDQGYVVNAVFIKAFENQPSFGSVCPWEEDQEMVARVCEKIGIPWETWNLSSEYASEVLEDFFKEYTSGRTPNPDILCNSKIKFGSFLSRSLQKGAQYIATGHYARVESHGGQWKLYAGTDISKDQSYFLYRLTQEQLARTLFPLGALTKTHVRTLARRFNLPNADRKDSQGICFVGKIALKNFLRDHIPLISGQIRSVEGEILGTHHGDASLTIGQRRGIGLGGTEALYVVDKNPVSHVVTVARGYNHPSLYTHSVGIADTNWISGLPSQHTHYTARLRYRQPLAPCSFSKRGEGGMLLFTDPQRAVAPGQSAVLYSGNEVIGGGIIQ